ncbi:MAG: hypothetical protein JSS60_08375 [Verrucomicrobia bacterium]|nr:hypothetical protein [Verrucomicrobiota bacterium]
MSVLPQELMRKISANSSSHSELSLTTEIPEERFRELLQVLPIDEKNRDPDFFSLLIGEEEEENPIDHQENHAVFCAPIAQPWAPLQPDEDKKDQSKVVEAPCVAPLSFRASDAGVAVSAPTAPTLAPEVEAAFEKMASCMIVMSSSHEVETTLFLDNPRFSSSSLFGTKITIREFSTAPKAFNIEIVSNPHAVAMIDASKNDLLSAFQNGSFNFTVHRFDTHLEQREDRPVLHRKESGDKEQKDQKGGRES